MSPFFSLVLGVLVVWRVTHLFTAEDGPANIFVGLRQTAGSGFWGSLLDCFYCLSLLVAGPVAYILGGGWKERLLLWPALSGGAIILERVTARAELKSTLVYGEDQEKEYVLRQAQSESGDQESASSDYRQH